MKQIFMEVKESLLKKKLFSILLFIQATVLFVLLSVLFLHFNNVDSRTKSFYAQYEGKNIYQLSDNLFGEKEEQFVRNENSLRILKDFYNHLGKSKDFIYLNTALQPIGVRDFNGNNTYLEGYGEGDGVLPPYDFNGKQYQRVKSLQINEQVLNTFDVELEQGRKFQTEDFLYTDNKVIPIILGSDYKSLYKIGDKLKIEYIFKEMEAEVVGILKSDTILPVRENIEFYTDKHIIMPSLILEQEPLNEDDKTFQRRQYLQLINGQVFTEKDTLQVRKIINDISQSTNFYDLTVIGANGVGIDLMMSMYNQNMNLLIMLVVILFCFCIFSIFLSFIMKWNINIKKYSIHFISGATLYNILSYMFVEVLFIMFLSISFAFIGITFVGIMPMSYYFLLISIGLVITILGMLPLYIRIKNLDISNLLKKKV
ncbi:ABC transporter permease [Lysinibacillus sp. Ag94]|uniref:ABC transporter permease n=1 Tax=Lysinibacillus sp. Ag94 TaxID=2936682 RepID=UPI00200FD676|nr:ABC transporter permease [Lysinibacillus sp. Ag94]UPW83054.1 ABC transporter permease [Lysinibacillus sp. Ag94]